MEFKFLSSSLQGGRNQKTIINAQTFFDAPGNPGYIETETFHPMMNQMKEKAPRLYKQYSDFLRCMQEGFLIRNTIVKKTHQTNLSDYYYLIFTKGRVKVEVTIYDVENIGKLIHDYADGLIIIQCGLDDLIAESSK